MPCLMHCALRHDNKVIPIHICCLESDGLLYCRLTCGHSTHSTAPLGMCLMTHLPRRRSRLPRLWRRYLHRLQRELLRRSSCFRTERKVHVHTLPSSCHPCTSAVQALHGLLYVWASHKSSRCCGAERSRTIPKVLNTECLLAPRHHTPASYGHS